MIEFFHSGGPFMWLLLIAALVIIIIFIKKTIELFGKNESDPSRLENGINAILFWGGISVVLGFFAHFVGVYKAMLIIATAHDVSPGIIAQGYAMSLITILFGLFIFIFAAIFWSVLRWRYKQLMLRLK